MDRPGPILAAGAVVWRTSPDHPDTVELLVIHRPKYDDWTFPKGKLDPGETLPVTAVREVMEETGVRIALGVPLSAHEYEIHRPRSAVKRVTYWVGRPIGGADPADYVPNREVDKVRWLRLDKVRDRLTYDRDHQVLDDFERVHKSGAHDTRTLVVLRHAQARVRKRWKRADLARPLTAVGRAEAKRLTPLLSTYGITRVVSSEATRCQETVGPFAHTAGIAVVEDGRLNEPAGDDDVDRRAVRKAVDRAMRKKAVVVCSHRLVLPSMFATIGESEVRLEPAGMLVVHHRDGVVHASERHGTRSGHMR